MENEIQNQEIIQEFEELIAKINTASEKYNFWNSTIQSNEFQEFIKDLRGKLDEMCKAWLRIKPSEFSVFQARALAIENMITELENHPEDLAAELSSLRSQKTRFEDQYALLLASAGYEVNTVPQKIEVVETDFQEDPEETTEEELETKKDKIRKRKPAGVNA